MKKIEQRVENTGETRGIVMEKIELRLHDNRYLVREDGSISGIAVPYGKQSVVLKDRARPYREEFTPNSLNISENVALYVQHDSGGLPLARTGAKTLQFEEESNGLRFYAKLPESRKDVMEAIHRGDIGGVSIGFIVDEDVWEHRGNGAPSTRYVKRATLIELSLVAAGAYPDALLD
jgi:uncharacterized protein